LQKCISSVCVSKLPHDIQCVDVVGVNLSQHGFFLSTSHMCQTLDCHLWWPYLHSRYLSCDLLFWPFST